MKTQQGLEKFLIDEMALVREYCSAIHKVRQEAGFVSLRYPLISVSLNRYFNPELRVLIAEECNLIGYMDIPPVEYDWNQKEMIKLDTTKTNWQQELFEKRNKKREIMEAKNI